MISDYLLIQHRISGVWPVCLQQLCLTQLLPSPESLFRLARSVKSRNTTRRTFSYYHLAYLRCYQNGSTGFFRFREDFHER